MRRPLSTTFLFLLATLACGHAATVAITYDLSSSSSSIDPFTIPNPGGNDFTVEPSANIISASMTVVFPSDNAGVISDGVVLVTDYTLNGTTNLSFTNGLRLFGAVGPLVRANLGGPLTATQFSDAAGGIVGLTTHTETTAGIFNTVGGPTGCTDNAAGLACAALETLVGVSFPLPAVPNNNATLPMSDVEFSGLNSTGSTASNALSFALPVAGVPVALPIDFEWTEVSRILVVPEPGTAALGLFGGLLLLRRRR